MGGLGSRVVHVYEGVNKNSRGIVALAGAGEESLERSYDGSWRPS